MKLIQQREIYWANLNPTKGHEQKGMRPVVIVSGNTFNMHAGLCIICPLSTKIKGYVGCIYVKKNKQNNLSENSEIVTFQIRTIAQERLTKKIGAITEEQLKEVFTNLADILRY